MFASNYQWLLVCLGNPGKEYETTRHNIGFMAADELARREGIKFNKLRYRALTGEIRAGSQRVLVIKPQTYMNLSGESVKLAGGFYKIPPERVLVISDDVALPLGKRRRTQRTEEHHRPPGDGPVPPDPGRRRRAGASGP